MLIITVNLTLVKFTTVLSCVKMNGEPNTAQKLKISTVSTHMNVMFVMVLGIVKMSITLLLNTSTILIPMVMVLSTTVMTSLKNT